MMGTNKVLVAVLTVALLGLAACDEPPPTQEARANNGDPLSEAVEFVVSEAEYTSGNNDSSAPLFRFYAALSALNYLQTNISPPRYGYLRRHTGNARPVVGTKMCLLRKAGLCGNQVEAFIDIMNQIEIPVREVQFYYTTNRGERLGHIAIEVEWGGKWHFFDVTWGMFVAEKDNPTEVASYENIRLWGERKFKKFTNQAYGWLIFSAQNNVDPFDYLTRPKGTIDVIIDGTGVVHPYMVDGAYSFRHIPRYVGHAEMRNGHIGEIKQEIVLPDGAMGLDIEIDAVSCLRGRLRLRSDSGENVVPIRPDMEKTISVSGLRGRVVLDVERGEHAICYLTLNRMVAS